MAIRIVREGNDEILRKKSKEIEEIDEKIITLANDMIETLHQYNGVGLAAPQVGILKKLIVIDLYEEGKPPFILINPELIKQKGEQTIDEGCLSFPNQFAKIVRPAEVTVKALDIEGNSIKIHGKELLAQALCHEIDHLNGELFIDKIIPGTLEIHNPNSKE